VQSAGKPELRFVEVLKRGCSEVARAADRPQPATGDRDVCVRRQGEVRIWNVTKVCGGDWRSEAASAAGLFAGSVWNSVHVVGVMFSRELPDVPGRCALLQIGSKTGDGLQPTSAVINIDTVIICTAAQWLNWYALTGGSPVFENTYFTSFSDFKKLWLLRFFLK